MLKKKKKQVVKKNLRNTRDEKLQRKNTNTIIDNIAE